MKKIIALLSFFICFVSTGQNATFTNQGLENYLLTNQSTDTSGDGNVDTILDVNNNGQIELSEIQNVDNITIGQGVGDVLTDLVQFVNLQRVSLVDYNHNAIDFSNNASITEAEITLAPTTVSSFDIELNNIETFILKINNQWTPFTFSQMPDINFLPSQNIEVLKCNKGSSNRNGDLNNFHINNLNNLNKLELANIFVDDLQIDNLVNLEEVSISNSDFVALDFASALVLKNLKINRLQQLTTLNIASNTQLEELSISTIPLLSSLDYQNKINLQRLRIDLNNQIPIDFTNLVNLKHLYLIRYVTPIDIDFSPLINLEELYLDGIYLNNPVLDLSSSPMIKTIYFHSSFVNGMDGDFSRLENFEVINSYMQSLDLKAVPNLNFVQIINVQLLENIAFENGADTSFYIIESVPDLMSFSLRNSIIPISNLFVNLPVGVHLCVDDDRRLEFENAFDYFSPVVNSYCAFTPAGEYSEINGVATIDIDLDGCDMNDTVYSALKYLIDDGSESGIVTGKQNGAYYLPVLENGSYVITPQPENPSYWSFNPPSVTVDFPSQSSPFTQDFCVTPNGSIEDLEIIVTPIEQARPGFETDYKVMVKNKGNQNASGSLTLDFDPDYMTLFDSAPVAGRATAGQLDWSFTDIAPFQMEEYSFTMTLNTPTDANFPLNGGDELSFTGTVTGTGTDNMPADNTMTLEQTVVNSFDPNDKRCLEGEKIEQSMVGEYVHYMIRFENTGTASAINVVVKDAIDPAMFDVSTFVPLGGSHDYYVRTVEDGNTFEFIHENINLDFNDATNDGYVLFKIKTLSTLTEGDTFNNDAEIYFDFNAPIVTNDFVTTVQSTASVSIINDDSISISPNPTSGIIQLNAKNAIKSLTAHDLNGRLLNRTSFVSGALSETVNLENLNPGIYLMTVETSKGQTTERVVVK